MSEEPRALTANEVRDAFLMQVAHIVDYWENESRAGSVRARLEGVAFSILVALDGSAAALPGFRVSPDPHESDEAFRKERGENWYPNDVDIAGALHEGLHDAFRKTKVKE